MECNEDLGSSCNLELEQDFSPLDTYIESVDSDAISGIQGAIYYYQFMCTRGDQKVR